MMANLFHLGQNQAQNQRLVHKLDTSYAQCETCHP